MATILKRLSWGFWREVAARRLALWATIPSAVALFGITVLLSVYIVSRKLAHPLPGVPQTSEEFMILIVVLPLANVAVYRGHVFFDVVAKRFPERVGALCNAVAAMLGSLLFGLLAWGGWRVAIQMTHIREYRIGDVDYPYWPFRLLLALGFSLLAFQLAVIVVQELHRAFRKRKVEPPTERSFEIM